MSGLTVKQEKVGDTVVEAAVEVAELALLVLDNGVSGVESRVSGLKWRVEGIAKLDPQNERVKRVELLVASLSEQVMRRGAGGGAAMDGLFAIDEVDEGREDRVPDREARKEELAAIFSRRAPRVGGGIT
jgi:hypothetical protein